MPRPTLFDHPKFHRLVHILGIPEPHALGHLEFLWRVGYSSGNPIIGDELDVEIASKWPGDRGKLAAALLEVGFVDRNKKGKLQIHNLHANAPDYVKSRFRMERYRHRTVTGQLRNSYHSPAPAPAPAPSNKEGRSKKPKKPLPLIPDTLDTPLFREAWDDYGVHRSEIRKPLTPKAASMQLSQLAPLGPEKAAEAIRYSISKGWIGVFPPEKKSLPSPNTVKSNIPDAEQTRRMLNGGST